MTFSPTLFPTTATAPIRDAFPDIDQHLYGYARQSIGGTIGMVAIDTTDFYGLPMSDKINTTAWLDRYHPNLRLFDDVQKADHVAGRTDYRGVFIRNKATTSATGINLWLLQPVSGLAAISVWNPTVDAGGNIERVANETTAPAGAVWTTPTEGVPMAIGTLASNATAPLWIKRAVGATASTWAYDTFQILMQATGDTGPARFQIIYSLLAGAATVTVTAARGGITTWPHGENYTLAVADAAGAAVDPPGNTLLAVISASTPWPEFDIVEDPVKDRIQTVSTIQPCIKTGTGAYRLDFRPRNPGHHQILWDAGGEASTQTSVEVSPVS